MVYRRRMYKKRAYGRRRARTQPWYSKKYSVGDLAGKAWRATKYIKSLINVEKHKVDFTEATAATTTPVVQHVTAVAIGDTEGTRTGNSILAKYLYLKCNFALNTSQNFDRVRLVVLRDKQQIADTAPSYTDVYTGNGAQSFLNPLTVGRFDILMDKLWQLDAQRPAAVIERYIRLNSHVRYNGSNATDQQKGAIYVMYIGSNATDGTTAGVRSRLCYIDN